MAIALSGHSSVVQGFNLVLLYQRNTGHGPGSMLRSELAQDPPSRYLALTGKPVITVEYTLVVRTACATTC